MCRSTFICRFLWVLFFVAGSFSFVFAEAGDSQIISLGEGLKMHFIKIARGSYIAGDSEVHKTRAEAGLEPQQVQLTRDFLIGKFEVTQAQYQKIMGKNPSYYVPGQTGGGAGYSDTSNHPVEQVSWYDAIRFCNALSVNQGLMPCYTNSENGLEIRNGEKVKINWDAKGFRLPTVAEWTYCCRAGTKTFFPWGDGGEEALVKENCWYNGNADFYDWTVPHAEKAGTQPVGTKLANPWGLHDMFGNVAEWCWDAENTSSHALHGKEYKIASDTYKAKILVDPKGIETEDYCYRKYMGGCYGDSYSWFRLNFEGSYHPDEPTMLIGFRVLAIR